MHLPSASLQLQFTSTSLPYSKTPLFTAMSYVFGLNLHNQCHSRADDRTKLSVFNSGVRGRKRDRSARPVAAIGRATDRCEDRIV